MVVQYTKIPRSEELVRRARFLTIVGDETRIRLLCFLFRYDEACVSDMAKSIETSLNTTSHHLRIMKDAGLVVSERIGVKVCHKLVRDSFVDHLEKAICSPRRAR